MERVQGTQASLELLPQFRSKGNLSLLDEPLTALFCSQRCPGDLILKTYDLARAMRDAGVPVIGGFQTPMERECLRLLLRGRQPVVVCPARGIDNMRVPRDWRAAIDDGRLLVLSPFPRRSAAQPPGCRPAATTSWPTWPPGSSSPMPPPAAGPRPSPAGSPNRASLCSRWTALPTRTWWRWGRGLPYPLSSSRRTCRMRCTVCYHRLVNGRSS